MLALPRDGAAQSDTELAKQTQNPVADLISVPFQNNTTFGNGPYDRAQNVLNIQPVIPIGAGEVNLINRTIVPLVWQPDGAHHSGGSFGLGDIQHTVFVSPANGGPVIWGVGPIIQLPTSTSDRVGPGKFGLGPSAVVLAMPGAWVVGALINDVFSLAGDPDTPYVNQMLLQPFVNYNISTTGWYLVSSPIMTANWRVPSDQRWLVPVGGGFGKVFKVASQPLNVSVQGFYNAERPDGFGDTTLRVQLQLLFPKG